MDKDKNNYSYSSLSEEELSNLLPDIVEMNLEEIYIFRTELEKRNRKEDLEQIDAHLKFLELQKEHNGNEISENEIKTLLKSGEYIENINYNLKEKGLDIIEYSSTEQEKKEQLFEYMTKLKAESMTEEEINKKISESQQTDETNTKVLMAELNRKGIYNVQVGVILVFVAIVLGGYLLLARNRISFGPIGLIITGIWQINKGRTQQQKNNS